MFGFLGFFKLVFFVYLGAAILIIAVGYDYVDKHYPKVKLPYKEQVYGLQEIILNKVDGFIEDNDKPKEKKSIKDKIKDKSPL